MDPEAVFENAGQENGLKVWRIENSRPVPYPKHQYGKFYNGDSIMVLNSNADAKDWDIHYWLGSETTQGESDAAAIFSMKLDELLGGAPTLHREVQEHESQKFLSYFEWGVRYLPGGIRTAFARVDLDAIEKRLYHVQGNRNIRLKLVDVHVSSLNKRDCFILDAGKVIYVYLGNRSRTLELQKVSFAAYTISMQDHDFETKFTICEQDEQSEMDEFFDVLGSGSLSEVPDYPAAGDEQSEKGDERVVSLFKVSDNSGHLKVTPVANEPPFEETSLDQDECFILDTGDSNIFLWVGGNVTERQEAMAKADCYLEDQNRPKWTHVERVVQASNFNYSDLYVDDIMLLDLGHVVYIWQGWESEEEEKSKVKSFVENFVKRNHRKDVKIVVLKQGLETEEFKDAFPWGWEPEYWYHPIAVFAVITNY